MSDARDPNGSLIRTFQIVGDDSVGPVRVVTLALEFAGFLAEEMRYTSGMFVRAADGGTYAVHMHWRSEAEAKDGHAKLVEHAGALR